jgi:hypothetical protein
MSSNLTQIGNMRVSQHRYVGAPFSSLLLFWHGCPDGPRAIHVTVSTCVDIHRCQILGSLDTAGRADG